MLGTRYFGGFGGGGQTVAGRTYDVSPDGRRFLMIKDVAPGDQNATPASVEPSVPQLAPDPAVAFDSSVMRAAG